MKYNFITGELTGPRGHPLKTTNDQGYIIVKFNGKRDRGHRVAWFLMTGEWPIGEIDHVNNQRNQNAWINLRDSTHQENQQNQKSPSKNNKSGYLGVSWHKQKQCWRATIYTNGKQKHLGLFNTPQEASECYLEAKALYHKGYSK